MIDLHIHTTASDGQYTPTQIIQKAQEKNISIIAITDHDTVDGLEEAKKAIKNTTVSLVPGVEININFPCGEFHLLGLGLQKVSSSLEEVLSNLVKNRDKRNAQIIQKMRDDGIDISLEEIQNDFPHTIIGRPHFAAELVKKKIVKNRQQAFSIYLAKGRKWYSDRIGANLDEAIMAIKDSKGIPVLAHPMSLYVSWGKLPELMKNFKDQGIMGLEAFHPGARVTECLRLEELAKSLGLLVTGGSDFHGEQIRADRKLGYTCGNKKLSEELFEPLEKYIYYEKCSN